MDMHRNHSIESKLTTLRQISQQSEDLRARVDAALSRCLNSVLSEEQAPPTTTQVVKSVIKSRNSRAEIFGTDIFRDPAWDMLLDLYVNRDENRETSVSSLCIAAGVPATTGLRYIAEMEANGFLSRRKDKRDARRVLIDADPLAMTGVERAISRISVRS
jgi:hypothetical protein